MEPTVEELQKELNGGGTLNVDLKPDEMVEIRRTIRAQFVQQFQTLKLMARLHRTVGNEEQERSHRDQAEMFLKLISALDEEVKLSGQDSKI